MQNKHWAEAAVLKLVNLGVTDGFPDGTFRGKKKVTRYEIAGFLDKLAGKFNPQPKIKKLLAELKTEFNVEKYKIENPALPTVSGSFRSNLFLSQANTRDLITNYRLKLNFTKKYSSKNRLTINFDTLDGGYYTSTPRNLTNELIDINGCFRFLDFDFTTSFGAGDIIHSNPLVPSKTGMVFRRARPSITAKVKKNHTTLSAGYTVLGNSANGLVSDQDIFITAGYSFKKLPLLGKTDKTLTLHYVRGAGRDVRADIRVISERLDFYFGMGSGKTSGLYLGAEARINNLKLSAHRIGSQYSRSSSKYSFLPLNRFYKYIIPGTCDIGLEYTHPLSKNIRARLEADLVLSGDYRYGKNYPGTSLTSKFDIILDLNQNSKIIFFYKNFDVPSGTNYTDPAIASSVPIRSDLIGFGLEAEL
ncbi:MAG: S-layer homology domain-containing protein [Candidatus Saganbacteria bacterium]|nr:S-layer homology domain-containing protein [Candidatus Saganbacteria bacterium]